MTQPRPFWFAFTVLISAVAVLGTFVTGCGNNDSTTTEPTTSGGESTEASLKVARIPMRTDGPRTLDPIRGSTTYDNSACSMIFETLLQYEYLQRPTDATALRPLLAAEMPTISEDGLVYTFKLKPGVKFHDDPCFPNGKGREFKAADVVFSWKRIADPKNGLKTWWLLTDTIVGLNEFQEALTAYDETHPDAAAFAPERGFDKEVEGLKVIDDLTLEVRLTEPVSRFLYTLTMFQLSIVPREAIEKYGDEFSRHPIGTGPFTLKPEDWVQGSYLHVNRNPNYHDCYYPTEGSEEDRAAGLLDDAGKRLPLLDRIEVSMFREDQPMWLQFDTGNVDYTQVPNENFAASFVKLGRAGNRTFKLSPELEKRGVTFAAVPLLDFIFYGFNMEDPLLGGYDEKHKKLRQALCLAMNWDERNELFYSGINAVYDGPIPVGLDGHPEGGRAAVSYRGLDLQRAKQLLAEAGYPNGEGLPPIEFYTSVGGNNAQQADLLIRNMEAIGVKVQPKLVDFSALMLAVDGRTAPWFSFGWGSDYPDPENNLALFYSPNASPGANHFNYSRPEYDAMYEQIRSMQPSPERTAIVTQMRDMLIEDAPYAGSMGRTRFYLINPRLKNFKPTENFYNWVKYLDVED